MKGSIFSEAEPAPRTPHEQLLASLRELDLELEGVQHDYRMLNDTNGYGIERSWGQLNDVLGGAAKSPTSVTCLQRHFYGKTLNLCGERLQSPLSSLGLPERQRILDLRRERLDDMRVTVATLSRAATLGRPASAEQHPIKKYEMADMQPNDVRMVTMLERLTFGMAGWTKEALEALMASPQWKSHERDLQVLRDSERSAFIGHYATRRTSKEVPYTRSILGTPVEKGVLQVESVGIAAGYHDSGAELVVHRLVQDLMESTCNRLEDGIDEAHP